MAKKLKHVQATVTHTHSTKTYYTSSAVCINIAITSGLPITLSVHITSCMVCVKNLVYNIHVRSRMNIPKYVHRCFGLINRVGHMHTT